MKVTGWCQPVCDRSDPLTLTLHELVNNTFFQSVNSPEASTEGVGSGVNSRERFL
jgi:hypothetical protein